MNLRVLLYIIIPFFQKPIIPLLHYSNFPNVREMNVLLLIATLTHEIDVCRSGHLSIFMTKKPLFIRQMNISITSPSLTSLIALLRSLIVAIFL